MEYKIGQIFEIDGIWYQFIEDNSDSCGRCVFSRVKGECANPDEDVKCAKLIREDGKSGHFVRLLPIGDVYEQGGATWQQYKCVEKPNTEDKRVYIAHTDSEVALIVSIRLTSSNGIERKIGEVFEYNGEWYQCVESCGCALCAFNETDCDDIDTGSCEVNSRSDGKSVVFRKLEKVGEPYNIGKKVFQRYEVFTKPYIFNDEFFTINTPVDDSFISVEIKQNEDMEETNANLSNSENIGKNLKPFDLQKAKEGKPVCTRDGRKARIICFDRDGDRPIIALITDIYQEKVEVYYNNGQVIRTPGCKDDLMMLPEKKEGWVNVYKETSGEYYMDKLIHKTEKGAFSVACPDNYIGTVKIEWYE